MCVRQIAEFMLDLEQLLSGESNHLHLNALEK